MTIDGSKNNDQVGKSKNSPDSLDVARPPRYILPVRAHTQTQSHANSGLGEQKKKKKNTIMGNVYGIFSHLIEYENAHPPFFTKATGKPTNQPSL